MKYEEKQVVVDYTEKDVTNIILQEYGEEILPKVVLQKLADSMSKLQIPLFYEEWLFSDFDLLRIVTALQAHPEEAQEFIASVYQLIKVE